MKANDKNRTTISRVCELLHIAEEVLRTNPDLPMTYTRFKHPNELAKIIQNNREKLLNTDLSAIEELSTIFAPTGDWDDCVGESDLANEVYELLEEAKQS